VKSVGEGSEGEEIESSVLVLWGVERMFFQDKTSWYDGMM